MTDETPTPRTRLRTIVVFSMLFAVLGAVALFAYFATFSRPVTTVIVVRHAEKNIEPSNPDPDLSPAGQARAQESARMFGDAGINAIYATQYKRTQQTVKPLGGSTWPDGQFGGSKEHAGVDQADSHDSSRTDDFRRRSQQHSAGDRQGARRRRFPRHSGERIRQHVYRDGLQIRARRKL